MNHNDSREPDQAETVNPLRPHAAAPSLKALPEPAEPLLLPAPDPASNSELPYEEQDIDGYTITEAHAALEAFKRRRNR